MSISVLTIVRNRPDHLAKLIEGLERSSVRPDELVVVDMSSDPPVTLPAISLPIKIVRIEGGGLPLAAARNAAANAAVGEHLLFLDVDCIPMRGLVGAMDTELARGDGLVCAEAFYLGPADARGEWSEEELSQSALAHPVRTFPTEGTREEANAGLFWSLVFGIRKSRFDQLGGFDEAFVGYGAEDTDFGFRAKRSGVPLIFMGGAGAFHQHHVVLDPPLQHLDDILRNARIFRDRWGVWPMEGWLDAFALMGCIVRSDDDIVLRRKPTHGELVAAQRPTTF